MTHLYKLLIPESSKNSTFILKNSPNIRYLSWYLTRYLTRGRVTRPQSSNFIIRLGLDLGHQLLVFASPTNLESGPRFADTCTRPLHSPHRTLLSCPGVLPCHIDLLILVVIFLIPVQHTTREDFEKWWKKRKERKRMGRPVPPKILEMGWEDAIFYHLQSKNPNRKVPALFWGHAIQFEDWTAATKATSAAIFDTCKHLQNCGCTEELQIPFVARACVGNIPIPHPLEEHISKCGKLQIWSVTSHQATLL